MRWKGASRCVLVGKSMETDVHYGKFVCQGLISPWYVNGILKASLNNHETTSQFLLCWRKIWQQKSMSFLSPTIWKKLYLNTKTATITAFWSSLHEKKYLKIFNCEQICWFCRFLLPCLFAAYVAFCNPKGTLAEIRTIFRSFLLYLIWKYSSEYCLSFS